MPPIEYDFKEQLAMSEGVSANKNVQDILLANIPGAVSVIRAHQSNDRSGVDYWVEMGYGGFAAVDIKVRDKDYAKAEGKDDLALESFSVVEKKIVGWTRNPQKRTDYILWFWKDTGRWCLLPFRMLCKVFSDNWESWKERFYSPQQYTPRASGNGYHSECIFVPRKIVWEEIYKHYSGMTQKSWQLQGDPP